MKGPRTLLFLLLHFAAAGCTASLPPEPRSSFDPQQEIVFHNAITFG
jgi:hypothetical protein